MHGDSQTSILDPSDNSILCHRQVLHALDSLDFINHQNNVSGPTVSGLLPKGASVINGQTKEFDIEDQVQQLENGKVLEHETVLTGKMRWVVLPLVLLLVIMWRLFYTV